MVPNSSKRKPEEAEIMVIKLKNRLQGFGLLLWLVLKQELWDARKFCRITAVCLSVIPEAWTKFWEAHGF